MTFGFPGGKVGTAVNLDWPLVEFDAISSRPVEFRFESFTRRFNFVMTHRTMSFQPAVLMRTKQPKFLAKGFWMAPAAAPVGPNCLALTDFAMGPFLLACSRLTADKKRIPPVGKSSLGCAGKTRRQR